MTANRDNAAPPFESEEWNPFIVCREGSRIWFGFTWQRDAAFLCFMFACAFAFGSAGVFLEREGLRANLRTPTTCVGGTAVFVVAVLVALLGVKLLRGTNRIALLDAANGLFSAIDRKTGRTCKPFPCRELYINLAQNISGDAETRTYGRITIVGPEEAGGGKTQVEATIIHRLTLEGISKAVRELEMAATWKGVIGDEFLVNRCRAG